MSGKNIKYNFILKDIDHQAIIERYSLKIEPNKSELEKITKLEDIKDLKEPEIISFLDESKNTKKCTLTMFDLVKQETLPEVTDIHCYWCRHPFDTKPIGCPLKFVPSQLEKKYFSEITKDKYVIRQNIPSYIKNTDNCLLDEDKKVINNDYYETDGVFCSFNCCLAFIDENKRESMYNHSSFLLYKIYSEIFETMHVTLTPAPTWRLLRSYGGHLDITSFRDSFSILQFSKIGFMKELPKFKPIGWLYEEKPILTQ